MIAEVLLAATSLVAADDQPPTPGSCEVLDVVIEKSDPTFTSDGQVVAMRLYQECAFKVPGSKAGTMVNMYSTVVVQIDADVAQVIVDAAEDLLG